jgi:hypothetical protein
MENGTRYWSIKILDRLGRSCSPEQYNVRVCGSTPLQKGCLFYSLLTISVVCGEIWVHWTLNFLCVSFWYGWLYKLWSFSRSCSLAIAHRRRWCENSPTVQNWYTISYRARVVVVVHSIVKKRTMKRKRIAFDPGRDWTLFVFVCAR